ncbi:MAG: hypothetical protein M3P95_03915 [Actinomycetota bacterium]|nr:hypothetical protein [Actinomycetota bacterium]
MSSTVHELEVSLRDVAPRVWRRVRVPSECRLDELHRALQAALGWEDAHLHVFEVCGRRYGVPDPDWDDGGTEDESTVRLLDVAPQVGDRLFYEYDFGDSWEHDVVVRSVGPLSTGESPYGVLDGAGACPPEDVGGFPGYEQFVTAMRDPRHPEHDDYADWVGGTWDPDAVDLAHLDAAVRGLLAERTRRPGRGPRTTSGRTRRGRRGRVVAPDGAQGDELLDRLVADVAAWWAEHPGAPLPAREHASPAARFDWLRGDGGDETSRRADEGQLGLDLGPELDPGSTARPARADGLASIDAPYLSHGQPVDPALVDLELLRPVLKAKVAASLARSGLLDGREAGALDEEELEDLATGINPFVWTEDELDDVLLDALPRMSPVGVVEGARIASTVRVFLRWLAATGHRDAATGDPRHLLEDVLDHVEVELAASMDPPERYGLDSDDEALLRAWRARMAERRLLLGRGLSAAEPPRLRVAVPPVQDELRELAAATPALDLLSRLVRWLGSGRRATPKGNLGVAESKELVDVLDTGDPIDVSYGGHPSRTRSMDDLRGVSLVVRLAVEADVVRRQSQRLVPGPTARLLAEDPRAAWSAVASAAFRLPPRHTHFSQWEEFVVDVLPRLVAVLDLRDGPVRLSEVSDLLWWAVAQRWGVAHEEEPFQQARRDILDSATWRRLRLLELAGVVALGVRDAEPVVSVTPLGAVAVRQALSDGPFRAPVVGALSGSSPAVLAEEAQVWDEPDLLVEELRRWVAARGDVVAAGEIVDALLAGGLSPEGRQVLVATLAQVGAEAAEVVSRLESDPVLRPHARVWQVERGLAPPVALSPEDGAVAAVDALSVVLTAAGPAAVVAELERLGAPDAVAGLVAELWRAPGPMTVPVLEAVAAAGDKRLAKVARKAAFKARSRG